jgi:hypothetical protein
MNTSDPQGNILHSSTGPTTEELQAQYAQLRYLFVLTLASIVLICLAACVFMGKQWRTVKAQVEEQRKTVQTMWVDYSKRTQPLIRDFVRGLQGYAAQNRDFQPILEKHRKPLAEYFAPAAPPPGSTAAPEGKP